MRIWRNLLCAGTALCVGAGCGERTLDEEAGPVIDDYAAIARAGYADSASKAEELKAAVDAFVASPGAATLEAARTAWKAAREPYGQTEAFRFYDGPIDDPATGPEGRINAWPLDEAHIDYVQGNPASGIINDPAAFPTLSKTLLADQNENGGEKNISAGYHALEFLLWGQDLSSSGPGDRPHTDYVTGGGGTATHQDRRGQYLRLAAELLVDDLHAVRDAWAAGEAGYGQQLRTAGAKEALRRMLVGMGSLAGAELSGERMVVAYDNRDQEDEHSCFSDNTHRDLHLNALAVQNVYLGRYGNIDGPGLDELVRSRDADLDAKLKQQLEASVAAVQAIPAPFDQAIHDDTARAKILAAVRALQDQTDTIVEVASLLGIQINVQ